MRTKIADIVVAKNEVRSRKGKAQAFWTLLHTISSVKKRLVEDTILPPR